jgi:hypothetical protein
MVSCVFLAIGTELLNDELRKCEIIMRISLAVTHHGTGNTTRKRLGKSKVKCRTIITKIPALQKNSDGKLRYKIEELWE